MSKSVFVFPAIIFSVTALGLIVMSAISAGALGWLIVGVIVLCLFALGISHVGVGVFSRYVEAENKRAVINNDYRLSVLKLGYQPQGETYALLPPPQDNYESDIPVSVAGVSPQALMEYRGDAENLVALSKQLISTGEMARRNQIAPYHKARKNDYFRDVMVWTRAIQYLLANHMVIEEKRGDRHVGTFCIAGTVEQLWERMKS